MCLGCNEMKPKRELIRVTKDLNGNIGVDSTGKKNGRGAYVCKNNECIELVRKHNKLKKTFKTDIKESVFEELTQAL